MVSYYGKVIEFLSSGSLKLGHVTKVGKSRLSVVDQNGRHHSVTPGNVAVIHEGPENSIPFSELANRLELEILRLREEVDTELLWDTVASDTRVHSAEELSKLVMAASEEVTAGIGRRAKLRSAASAAVRVLELKDRDISPGLSTLLHQVLL